MFDLRQVMKLNKHETHDRLLHFKKQSDDISAYCQNMINQRPFGSVPFYIFAHKRSVEVDERVALYNQDFYESIVNPLYTPKYKSLEDVPSARLIWQPRLTKPKSQTNSMLFKAYPDSGDVKIIWIIPEREMWEQYTKGKLAENKTVCDSIEAFQTNRTLLEQKEPDDLTDTQIEDIYRQLSLQAKQHKYEII